VSSSSAYHPSLAASVNFASKDASLWSQPAQRRNDLSSLAQSQQITNDSAAPVRLSHIGSAGYPRRNKKHKPVGCLLLSLFSHK